MKTATRTLFVLGLILLASGCAGVAISSGTYAVKASQRAELEPLARSGDVAAQYELGKSWCCMGPGFDTQTATEWLCRAASAGHADAQYELGRIYDGDVSRTPAPGQKLLRLASARRSEQDSIYWLSRAAGAGHVAAAERLANHDAKARAAAAGYEPEHCVYDEVIPK